MKRITLTAAVAVAAIALAACGSSGGNAGSAGSAGSAAAPKPTFTGTPIKVGIIFDETTVSELGNPQPEIGGTAQAGIDAINAAGGINGSEVQLVKCDDKGNPNTAANCARTLISDGVVATLGDQTTSGQQLNPVLQTAGIPRVGPLVASAAEFNETNNFPTNGGAPIMFQGAVLNAKANGAKSIFIVYTEAPGSGTIPALLGGVMTQAGIENKGQIGIPPGAPDLSSYVAKAMNSGADAVLTTFGPDMTQQFLQAATQQGAKFRVTTVAEAMDNHVIDKLGATNPLVSSSLLVSPFPPVADTSIPGIKLFNEQLDAAEKAGDKSLKAENRGIVLNTWVATYAFGQIAKTITGPVTAKSVTTALNTVKDVDMLGIIPPWTPSKSGGMFKRISNGYGWYIKVNNGKQVLDKTAPQSILPTS